MFNNTNTTLTQTYPKLMLRVNAKETLFKFAYAGCWIFLGLKDSILLAYNSPVVIYASFVNYFHYTLVLNNRLFWRDSHIFVQCSYILWSMKAHKQSETQIFLLDCVIHWNTLRVIWNKKKNDLLIGPSGLRALLQK